MADLPEVDVQITLSNDKLDRRGLAPGLGPKHDFLATGITFAGHQCCFLVGADNYIIGRGPEKKFGERKFHGHNRCDDNRQISEYV